MWNISDNLMPHFAPTVQEAQLQKNFSKKVHFLENSLYSKAALSLGSESHKFRSCLYLPIVQIIGSESNWQNFQDNCGKPECQFENKQWKLQLPACLEAHISMTRTLSPYRQAIQEPTNNPEVSPEWGIQTRELCNDRQASLAWKQAFLTLCSDLQITSSAHRKLTPALSCQ